MHERLHYYLFNHNDDISFPFFYNKREKVIMLASIMHHYALSVANCLYQQFEKESAANTGMSEITTICSIIISDILISHHDAVEPN